MPNQHVPSWLNREKVRGLSSLTASILAGLAVLPIVLLVTGKASGLLWAIPLIVLVLLSILQIFWRALQRDAIPAPDNTANPLNLSSEIAQTIQMALKLESQLSSTALYDFVTLAVDPIGSRSRVSESIDIDRNNTRKTVSLDINITSSAPPPFSAPSSMLIPIAQPKKGRLYNNFDVSERSGLAITSLPFADCNILAVASMISLYKKAYNLDPDLSLWSQEFTSNLNDLVGAAIQPAHVLARNNGGISAQLLGRVNSAFSNSTINDPNAHSLSRLFAQALVTRFFIVIQAPAQTHYSINYSFDIPNSAIQKSASESEYSRPAQMFLRLFKISSGHVQIGLGRAERSKSYHLSVTVPDGSFMDRITIEHRTGNTTRSTRPASTMSPGYFRLPQRGASQTHFYSREAAKSGNSDYFMRLRVFERPTGSDLLSAFWLTIVLGITISLRQAVVNSESGSDFVAATLAYPLLIATAVTIYLARMRRSLVSSASALAFSLIGAVSLTLEFLAYALVVAGRNVDNLPWVMAVFDSTILWNVAVGISAWMAAIAISVSTVRMLRFWFMNDARVS